MQLSEHFTLEEFTVSQRAARLGIDNQPNAVMLERLKYTAERLETVRIVLGNRPLTISSAYRSEVLNAQTPGSAKHSAHTEGYAVDFNCFAFGTPLQVAERIKTMNIRYDQLIHEFGSWVHISFDPRMRGQELTIGHNGTVAGLHVL